MTIANLAVLGNPVAHSRSPDIHQRFGELSGIELVYEKILVPEGGFNAVAARFMEKGTGFNITVPCKNDAFNYIDQATDKAMLARAVNTVSRAEDGSLRGTTTDGEGMVRDIRDNLGWMIAEKRILVIGAGGAVSGVLGDLLAEGPGCIHLYNRTSHKAVALAARFASPQLQAVGEDTLEEDYDFIINGTSAGLKGQNVAIPGQIVSPETCCYDMVYGSTTTQFNRWCLDQAACTVSDGLGMLVEQAALAFEIWFGIDVETTQVITDLRSSLN